MEIISHRRNTIDDLSSTPESYGIEIDIRSLGSRLILQHDPFVAGTDFHTWLRKYRHGTIILNVKEDGLESAVQAALFEHKIDNYFFLDQSIPSLVKTAKGGMRHSAVRVSEYEPVSAALSFAGLIDWVWVDCFTRFPLAAQDVLSLRQAGFSLCLVSPELQGRSSETDIPLLIRELTENGISADAVCTKRPDLWVED